MRLVSKLCLLLSCFFLNSPSSIFICFYFVCLSPFISLSVCLSLSLSLSLCLSLCDLVGVSWQIGHECSCVKLEKILSSFTLKTFSPGWISRVFVNGSRHSPHSSQLIRMSVCLSICLSLTHSVSLSLFLSRSLSLTHIQTHTHTFLSLFLSLHLVFKREMVSIAASASYGMLWNSVCV